jgi:hypothetical protein
MKLKKIQAMKPLRFKHAAFILALLLLGSITLQAAEDEYSKNKKKEYQVNDQTVLSVTNKYGDVNITNWDKDIVSIDATVTVDHRNEEKARELLDEIVINLSREGNTITAETEFDKGFNRSGGLFDFDSDAKEFSIDYSIKMPKYLNIELENKYGDVFINEITGRADIAVKYGNLKANKILRNNTKPLSHVYLAYSNGNIGEVNWLKLTLKYTPDQCEIGKSKALIAMTKYSTLELEESSSLVCESKYDNYRIGTLANLVCEAKYTEFNIDRVTKQIDLDSKYGDFDVDEIPAGFKKIKVENSYGQIDLNIASDASYQLEGEAGYTDIEYPDESSVNRIERNTDLRVSGTVGKKGNPDSKVEINTRYGKVSLE